MAVTTSSDNHADVSRSVAAASEPARDLLARQSTLENLVTCNYSLCDSVQQACFSKLGVFSGWFSVDVFAWICYYRPHPAQAGCRHLLDELNLLLLAPILFAFRVYIEMLGNSPEVFLQTD